MSEVQRLAFLSLQALLQCIDCVGRLIARDDQRRTKPDRVRASAEDEQSALESHHLELIPQFRRTLLGLLVIDHLKTDH
jgi:hypothetical protein